MRHDRTVEERRLVSTGRGFLERVPQSLLEDMKLRIATMLDL